MYFNVYEYTTLSDVIYNTNKIIDQSEKNHWHFAPTQYTYPFPIGF
jgi:hypothetical protein